MIWRSGSGLLTGVRSDGRYKEMVRLAGPCSSLFVYEKGYWTCGFVAAFILMVFGLFGSSFSYSSLLWCRLLCYY